MLKTCTRITCQILYSSYRSGIYCPQCKQLEEQAFHVIRDLLVEKPHATVIEICKETDIPSILSRSW